jgi:hypothetical protein
MFMEDRADDPPDCPQRFYACIQASETAKLARNLRRLREWIRYAWGHCGPR